MHSHIFVHNIVGSFVYIHISEYRIFMNGIGFVSIAIAASCWKKRVIWELFFSPVSLLSCRGWAGGYLKSPKITLLPALNAIVITRKITWRSRFSDGDHPDVWEILVGFRPMFWIPFTILLRFLLWQSQVIWILWSVRVDWTGGNSWSVSFYRVFNWKSWAFLNI